MLEWFTSSYYLGAVPENSHLNLIFQFNFAHSSMCVWRSKYGSVGAMNVDSDVAPVRS